MSSGLKPLRTACWLPWASLNSTIRETSLTEKIDMLPTPDFGYFLFLVCAFMFIFALWIPKSWDERVQEFLSAVAAIVWREVSALFRRAGQKMLAMMARVWSVVFKFAYGMLSMRQMSLGKGITTDTDANRKDRTVKVDTQDDTEEEDSEGTQNTTDVPDTSDTQDTLDTPGLPAIPLILDTSKTSDAPNTPSIPGSSHHSDKSNASDTNDHGKSPLGHKARGSIRTDNETPGVICDGTRTSEIMEWVNVTRVSRMARTRSDGETSRKNE